MNKIKAKGRDKSRPRAVASSRRRDRQSAEIKLAELKRRLLEINDLRAARALLSWDHATYMPKCGATARARQGAIVSRLAHERSVAPELGKLLEELEPFVAGLPYDSNEASLVRVARRDFEKATKIPPDYVARVSAFGATAYDAWKWARPANDFATMVPFLERAIDLGREYADFFTPYEHVADPLIDDEV
jgi:carboxypeptidase Taq